MKPLKVLLVGPDYRMASGWITMDAHVDVRCDLAPVTLSTLAALTPEEVHVDLWDEPASGRITRETRFDTDYDFVGVTGYSGHIDHALRIASVFRERGILTGVGGPGVSVHPQAYREHFDVLFLGEAEETWPRFLDDLSRGSHEAEYRQITKPDLELSPAPDWSGLDTGAYAMGTLQTTRGCPFDCHFCDVIYLFGRHMRHKPVERVVGEVRELARQGFRSAFITDDEFVGDRRYAKALLRGMRDAQRDFDYPVAFATQATVNLSRDEELLELAADAGMAIFYVGIESINPETLKNINKKQNLNRDMVEMAHKVLSYGIALRGNSIVGFDEDDTSVFERWYRFHQEASIPVPAVTILQAPHGTPLWRKMVEKGQVMEAGAFERGRYSDEFDGYFFNTIPAGMTRVELMQGYGDLYSRLFEWKNIEARNEGWLRRVERPPQIAEPPFTPAVRQSFLADLDRRGVLDDEARGTIRRLIEVCMETHPSMWRRLQVILTMQAHIRHSLRSKIVPALEAQIAREKSGDFEVVSREFRAPVPRAFREELLGLLPPVYRRVRDNLSDPSRLEEAITRVFVDFLVRWSDEFEIAEPHHEVFLLELSDRTVAQMNGVSPESYVADPGDDSVRLPPMYRVRDDILRNLDIELGFEPGALAGGGSGAEARA